MLDQRTLPNEPKFIDMENIIHQDEKWYNTTKKGHDLLFTPGRGGPIQDCAK